MTGSIPRRGTLVLTVVLLTAGIASAQQASPEEDRARALAGIKVRFAAYLFDGKEFPRCECEQPGRAKDLLGPHTVRIVYHDRAGVVVTAAGNPGLYGAVVEIVPKEGRPLRRYVSLCRTAGKPEPDWRFDAAAPEGLARWTGIEPDVIKQHAEVIARELRTRTAAELVRDARIARLLGGLSLAKAGKEPARRYDDGFALERQYWVGLKRKLLGLDRVFAKPLDRPQAIKGDGAPVLREGTPAEAGMKADAAKKLDAVCREWAADDDQAFAVCVARKGVIVLHAAYGMRDGKPMSVTTKSWMASITKPMSATLMLMLADQGLVDLDDPVEKYLPSLRGLRKENPLTIRHLCTHTSGLEKWPAEWYQDELPDIEERVALAYPLLPVGKAWGYNGQGYTLGGKVIEAVSGEAVPQCFHKHLLGPLGCAHTDVIGTHADAFSVPLDIAKFGQMLLNRGAYGTQRFFSEETFEKMLPEKLTKVLGAETKKTFGIGLDGSREKFGHGAASAATFHVDRTDELVVIMTRNKMGKNQGKYGGKFWDAIRDGIDRRDRR